MNRLFLILFVSISLAGPASALIFSNGKVVTIPPNAYESGTTWLCNSGYTKSGDKCIKNTPTIKIPLNAHKSGSGWVCNTDFYLNSYRDGCIKVPPNAYSTNFSNYFLCKTGYERSGSRCIKNTTTPKIPLNAHKSDSGWICDKGFYRNSNRTGCLGVPKNARSTSFSNDFYCVPGYRISGSKCIKKTTSSDDNSSKWIILFIAFIAFLLYKVNSNNKTGTYRVSNYEAAAQRVAKKKAEAAEMAAKKKEWAARREAAMKKAASERAAKKKAEDEMAPKKKVWEKQAEERYKNRTVKEVRKSSITKPKSKVKSKVRVEETSLGFNVLHFEQGSDEWLEWRHTGIGASDASTVMGDNRFESPEELLYAKKNKIVEPPNEAMKKGTRLEPIARDLYIKETGINVIPLCLQDKKDSWIIASMDGITKDFSHIVEIKCGKSAFWQATRRRGPPDYYYGQLQHQMMITGLSEVDYYCYWPGQTSVLQVVKRDDGYIKSMYKAEQAFIRRLR